MSSHTLLGCNPASLGRAVAHVAAVALEQTTLPEGNACIET